MPQIIVTAGSEHEMDESTVMLRERITATDFESDRFAANLLERLGWAVEDATAAEHRELPTQYDTPGRASPHPERELAWDPEPAGIDPEPVGIA